MSETCEEKDRPKNKEQLIADLDKIAKTMGMNETCRRSQKDSLNEYFTNTSVDFETSAGWGLAKADLEVDVSTGGKSINNSSFESGCGTTIANTMRVMNATKRMKCTMNKNSVESSQSISGSATVSIRVTPVEGAEENFRMMQKDLIEAIKSFKEMDSVNDEPDPGTAVLVKEFKDMYKANVLMKREMGSIKIKNSTVTASGKVKLKKLTSNTSSMSSKLKEDYKDIVAASAEQHLAQTLGPHAMQGSVKMLVNKEVNNQNEDIEKTIQENITKTSVNVKSASKIEITAPDKIELENAEINANFEIDLQLKTVSDSAMKLGRTVANKVLAGATDKTSSESEAEGEAKAAILEKALQYKGLEAAQEGVSKRKATEVWGDTIYGIAMMVIVVAIVAGGIFYNAKNPGALKKLRRRASPPRESGMRKSLLKEKQPASRSWRNLLPSKKKK